MLVVHDLLISRSATFNMITLNRLETWAITCSMHTQREVQSLNVRTRSCETFPANIGSSSISTFHHHKRVIWSTPSFVCISFFIYYNRYHKKGWVIYWNRMYMMYKYITFERVVTELMRRRIRILLSDQNY